MLKLHLSNRHVQTRPLGETVLWRAVFRPEALEMTGVAVARRGVAAWEGKLHLLETTLLRVCVSLCGSALRGKIRMKKPSLCLETALGPGSNPGTSLPHLGGLSPTLGGPELAEACRLESPQPVSSAIRDSHCYYTKHRAQ